MKTLDKTKWVKTEDVIEFLKSDPNCEHEFSRYLGGMLRSTYWMEYKSEKNMFALLGKPGYEDMKAELEARIK